MKKILVLTDFSENLNRAAETIRYGNNALHGDVEVRHFIEQTTATLYPRVMYYQVKGKDFLSRLDKFCKERMLDILAFTHALHSIFRRMLRQGYVLALFVFPSSHRS